MSDRQLLGVRQTAKIVGVHYSTISRGIGRLYRNYGTADRPLLDVEEVRKARLNHVEPEKQSAAYAARGLPLPEPDFEDESGEDGSTGSGAGGRGTSANGELGRERLRMVRNQADRVEMENLERQKQLAPAADFSDAGFDLAQLLRRAQAARVRKLAETIVAANGDPAAITAALRASDKAIEEKMAQAVEKLLDGKDIEDTEFGTA